MGGAGFAKIVLKCARIVFKCVKIVFKYAKIVFYGACRFCKNRVQMTKTHVFLGVQDLHAKLMKIQATYQQNKNPWKFQRGYPLQMY